MSMNASQYSNEDYFTLLALHMPALTPAMGRPMGVEQGYDMVAKRTKHWGRDHFEYKTRWLHSDIKDMGYFYVYQLFQELNGFIKGTSQ